MGVLYTAPATRPDDRYETDLALTRAAAAGQVTARRQLAERLFDRVRATVSYVAAGPDAEDLAQIALLQILRCAGGFRGESALEVWADRVAVRCVLKWFEKRKRRERLAGECIMPSQLISDVTEAALEQRRARQRLSELLQALPTHQSITLVLHYLHGYAIEEIAHLMGAPINTVRGRVRAGRRKMKELILSDPVLCDWLERRGI